jgi:outer membrane protein
MLKGKFDWWRMTTLVFIVALIGAVVLLYLKQPRIAYVRSHDLIEKYQGTIVARGEFKKKKEGMLANVDSLGLDFERAKNQYLSTAAGLSAARRGEEEGFLMQRQNQLIQYSEAVDQKIREEDSKMMQEVLNQVNTFVEEYAVANGIDIVMGTTLTGSLLYGNSGYDITEDVLVGMNQKYQGK